jgi:hypothetical protein
VVTNGVSYRNAAHGAAAAVASACAKKEREQCAKEKYTFKAVETQAANKTNNLGRENQKDTTWGWGSLLEGSISSDTCGQ